MNFWQPAVGAAAGRFIPGETCCPAARSGVRWTRMDAGPSKLSRQAFAVLALVALVYGGGHLLWYWGTPLGQSAVLDERENLQLAAQITSGTLAHEPFYRAMGYPLLLAGLRTTGLLAGDVPAA